jgi:cyclopropane fatty-acyl-phospholipid synthase-like methyltransferase
MMMQQLRSSLPEPIKDTLRPFYRKYMAFKYKIFLPYYRFLDRFRLNDLNSIYDEEYFLKRTSHPWSTTTEEVVAELVDRYNPNNVIDVGCAIGVYMQEFEKYGVDVSGIEGAEKAVENAVVDGIVHADLRDPVPITKTADLVLCIEVAEHLHPKYADQLVETVSKCVNDGGVAILSAAPPGQRGTHHVNLQPKEYWIKKFESAGLSYAANETETLQETVKTCLSKHDIYWHATTNLMVYKS